MALRPLTDQERAAAREKAKLSRQARANAKLALKNREITIEQFLKRADTDEALQRIRVEDMLKSLPSIGEVRAAAIMRDLRIAPSRRLRGLGAHQRKNLIEYLEG
ncbi:MULTISPECIES: integration host factor, actinobacterial type [Kocuria]|uniref:integration host factor, actinobacterial type n=1 Tax=Kocuria TaxID=57493 RepID=UPI00065F9B60|nr:MULTISPECIES: integration host factor, actinobacterial type [Kocuria]MCT1366768.1 DNA-binding protein [Rothia sp. p3-SID1597]RUQ22644.1 DNA-binding protein [Kocuria sp. HSID16901]